MNKIFIALIMMLMVFSCSFDMDKLIIKYTIEGTDPAHIVINGKDFGYNELPFEYENKICLINHNYYNIEYNVEIYSLTNVLLKIYENYNEYYTYSNNYISYKSQHKIYF